MNIQTQNQLLDILKWIGIVFAAGFIGYFGRYLSMLIIERVHKKKREPSIITEETNKTTASAGELLDEKKLKLDKKRLKLEKKREKKQSPHQTQ